jgi:hypothetical protein
MFFGRRRKMTKNQRNRILLRACPRCHGDLFPDMDEQDFACLQCGRRIAPAQLTAILAATPEAALAKAA